MNGERILLDSVILIDHFNGHAPATDYLRAVADRASLSAITRAEVLTGFDADGIDAARHLLDHFPLLPIDQPVADIAARLRREHRWRLPDALQAAVTLHHGLRLATRNTRQFDPQQLPYVVLPYVL